MSMLLRSPASICDRDRLFVYQELIWLIGASTCAVSAFGRRYTSTPVSGICADKPLQSKAMGFVKVSLILQSCRIRLPRTP